MLGDDKPSLLVSVDKGYNPNRFNFHVVNGAWEGEFINGNISVFGPPGGDFTSLGKMKILCDDQARLRSHSQDYNDVFANFDNPNYVGPDKYEVHWAADDDIPF
jgi:hypothetical protein